MSTTSPSVILSQRDVEFLLYEWLQVQSLTAHDRYADHSREIFDAVLDLSRSLAEDHYRPHNQMSDAQEPQFDGERVHIIPEVRAALDVFGESGLLGSAMDTSVGGDQLPQVVARACSVWLQAANASTSNYHLLSAGNANLLAHYGTPDQIRRFVRPIVEGRFSGTMCLSEPQAGSSLSDVQTRAVPEGDAYRIFGSKMWISGGDHELTENIVHLVLARIEGAPAGVKGLSLFIVPRFLVDDDARITERNDVILAGVNHKMGQRGCVNTVLTFGEGRHLIAGRPGAVGYLVGEAGQGLAYMFHMMNEARIAVGSLAVALGYTGYLHSLDYARTRLQGRLPSAKDPSLPQTAIVHHPDVRRMLLTQKSYVEGGLGLVLYVAMLLDRIEVAPDESERERLSLLLDVLTPIVKAWPSQWCLKANDLAIQVLGGYGYTRDYPVEQYYRDNRLNPIHEGTDGIQSLDLLGRKVVMKEGRALAILADEMGQTIAAAPTALADQAADLAGALARLIAITQKVWSDGNPDTALANSFLYLEAFGHTVIAWMWLEQMIAADGKADPFYDGKRLAGRYFFTYELPRIMPLLDVLESKDRLFVDLDDASL